MSRVTVPGGCAELADPADVPERFARPVRNRSMGLSGEVKRILAAVQSGDGGKLGDGDLVAAMTEHDAEVLAEVNDLTVCALVTAWSWPMAGARPTPDEVLDLPKASYDGLLEAVAPAAARLMGVDFGPSPEAGSPT